MKKIKKPIINIIKNILLSLFFIPMVFLTSCHSEYLSLSLDIHWGGRWNNERNMAVFVASKAAFRQAAGISRMPDGGKPDYLVQDVSLYIFKSDENKVIKLIDFKDLVELSGIYESRWDVKLAIDDYRVFYFVSPVPSWETLAKISVKAKKDPARFSRLKEKYRTPYSINIQDKKTARIELKRFNAAYAKNIKSNEINSNEIKRIIDKISMKEWGLVVQKIYPKPDEDYIDETIYLHNQSKLARRAVVEQIISKMDKKDIRDLLRKMDEYKNSLKNYKKSCYELYSKETYESIRQLL